MPASAPSVDVDICNLAGDLLKQSPITSITTPREANEVIFARWYHMCRRALLRAHIWNFAIKRAVITTSSTAPAFGYTNAYNLPNDFVRIVELGDDTDRDFTGQYQVENGQLLLTSDANSLNLRYIYDLTNVAQFDALFVDVLCLYLAVRLSNKFSIAASLKTELKNDFKEAWSNAMSVDGQERPPKRIQRSKFLARRRGSASPTNPAFVVFD